jgi:molybdopterin converting factor small subunit
MKIHLKFFLPGLPEVIGGNQLSIDFEGTTVHDLIEFLFDQYGSKARDAIYDKLGEFDPMVQVLLNGEQWITQDQLDTILEDGDSLVFMLLMAGG